MKPEFTTFEKLLDAYNERVRLPVRKKAAKQHALPFHAVRLRHLALRRLNSILYPGTIDAMIVSPIGRAAWGPNKKKWLMPIADRLYGWSITRGNPRWDAMQRKKAKQFIDANWKRNEAVMAGLDIRVRRPKASA